MKSVPSGKVSYMCKGLDLIEKQLTCLGTYLKHIGLTELVIEKGYMSGNHEGNIKWINSLVKNVQEQLFMIECKTFRFSF